MKARARMEERIPTLQDVLSKELIEAKICESGFDLTGVLTALKVVGRGTTICVREVNGQRLIGYATELDQLRHLPSVVRVLVSKFGCAHLDRLGVELKTKISEECLRSFAEECSGVRWLDQQRQWFTADDAKRNRLSNVVRKVLCVAPSIAISELRRGVKRVHRLQGFAPGTPILRQFCAGLPYCRVDEDRVIATENLCRAEILGETELCFYDVLTVLGPAMHTRRLQAECVQRGMNENTFFQYLTYSPIIYRTDREVYSIIGAEVAPGVVEDLRRRTRQSPVVIDTGWTSDGRPWIEYRLNAANIRSGVLSIPMSLSGLMAGRYSFDSSNSGSEHEMMVESGRASGLRRVLSSCGAEEGDVLRITFDLSSRHAEMTFVDDTMSWATDAPVSDSTTLGPL
jgi:hypothetical protein